MEGGELVSAFDDELEHGGHLTKRCTMGIIQRLRLILFRIRGRFKILEYCYHFVAIHIGCSSSVPSPLNNFGKVSQEYGLLTRERGFYDCQIGCVFPKHLPLAQLTNLVNIDLFL